MIPLSFPVGCYLDHNLYPYYVQVTQKTQYSIGLVLTKEILENRLWCGGNKWHIKNSLIWMLFKVTIINILKKYILISFLIKKRPYYIWIVTASFAQGPKSKKR